MEECPIVLDDEVSEVIRSIAKQYNIKTPRLKMEKGSSPGDNFMGQIVKIEASGAGESDLVMHFLAKLAPKVGDDVISNNVYKKEIAAYTQILPAFMACQKINKFRIAKYYAGSSTPKKEYVIMEDLSVWGYKMYDRRRSFDEDHLALMVKTIASFHALSFVFERNYPEEFRRFCKLVEYEMDYGSSSDDINNLCTGKAIACIDDLGHREQLKRFLGDHRNRGDTYMKVEKAAPYNVMTHGDCWTGNVLFKYENKVGAVEDAILLDWQTMRVASPITDIAYMLSLCTDGQVRDRCFQKTLELYYETLSKDVEEMGHSIEVCYPRNVYWEHVKSIMPVGLITATVVLPMLLVNEGDLDYESEDPDAWLYVPVSDQCKERLNDIVRDFIKYKYI